MTDTETLCADCPDLPNGTRKRQICCRRVGQMRELKVGDRVPVPPKKLDIRPAKWADDTARSPKGVFRNGTR